jgi:hypothetical protein
MKFMMLFLMSLDNPQEWLFGGARTKGDLRRGAIDLAQNGSRVRVV